MGSIGKGLLLFLGSIGVLVLNLVFYAVLVAVVLGVAILTLQYFGILPLVVMM